MSVAVAVRDCPSFPGYAASDDGRAFSRLRRVPGRNRWGYDPSCCRELKASRRYAYLVVTVTTSTGRRPVGVHQLVMDAFVGPCPAGQQIRHVNGVERGNALTNLAYGTPAQNGEDKRRLGEAAAGSRNGRARLSESDVVALRAAWAAEPRDIRRLASRFGIGKSQAHNIVTGAQWRPRA